MPIILKIEEHPTRYKTLSITNMEPREAFIGRTMRRSNVQVKLLMRTNSLEVKPKGGETV
jgi:hypothetical protein